jgi:hypothetical protein
MFRIPFISIVFGLFLLVSGCTGGTDPDPCIADPSLPQCQPEPEPECKKTNTCIVPKLQLNTTFKKAGTGQKYPIYNQGERVTGDLEVLLLDPDKLFSSGSVFFSLVRCNDPEPKPCATPEIISDQRTFIEQGSSTIEPDIFKQVYSGDDYRDGKVKTRVDVKIRSDVAAGLYSITIPVHECSNVDPVTVGTDASCTTKYQNSYKFRVE